MKKRTIFIDWNGTLSDSFFWEHLRLSKIKKSQSLYKVLDAALFSDNKEMIVDWMRAKYTTEQMMEYVSKKTGVDYKLVFREFVIGCRSMKLSDSKLPRIIKQLRLNGNDVVIATNNMDCFDRWTVKALSLDKMFSAIINSYDKKALKHDVDDSGKSLFFAEYFETKVIVPSNCVFIDDSEDKNGYISGLGMEYIKIGSSNELVSVLSRQLLCD